MWDLSVVLKMGLAMLGTLAVLVVSGIFLKILYLAFMLGWNLQ